MVNNLPEPEMLTGVKKGARISISVNDEAVVMPSEAKHLVLMSDE